MPRGYLRYPHVHGDLLTFVAGHDVWLAPAAGGRASRFSSDDVPVSCPRFSRDGTRIAWTSWRDGSSEVYLADTEGSAASRLTFWGDPMTRVTGWTADGAVLANTAAGQPAMKYRREFVVPAEGAPRLLPFGPVNDVALEAEGTVLLTGSVGGEPAFWKRYRGGRAGKLWTATGADPLFTRILADVKGQFGSPMLIGGRAVLRVRLRGHRATSTRVRWTAATWPGTPTTTASTRGTRPPTAPGSSTTWPATSGCWTAPTRPSRTGSR